MPADKIGGTHAYVTGTARSSITFPLSPSKLSTALQLLGSSPTDSAPSSSISPPPAYTTIYPPSPPSSVESASSIKGYTNPLHTALASPGAPIRPILTPRSSSESLEISILATVFDASSPIHALPSETADLHEVVPSWKGAVVDNAAAGTRTLYVSGSSFEEINMRESVCGVLEMAEEELSCTGVVMCLEKNSSDLGELIHQLLYVGGTITNLPFAPNSDYILVGLDL